MTIFSLLHRHEVMWEVKLNFYLIDFYISTLKSINIQKNVSLVSVHEAYPRSCELLGGYILEVSLSSQFLSTNSWSHSHFTFSLGQPRYRTQPLFLDCLWNLSQNKLPSKKLTNFIDVLGSVCACVCLCAQIFKI